ncbi:cytochrome C [Sulfurospirillum sp. 1307]|jgi:hypothetical protein
MKKIFSSLIVLLTLVAFTQQANASVVKGKRYYIQLLKKPCGFKGDVMGKYHTKREWRNIYRSGKLAEEIQRICPKAPNISSKKKQKNLYHFFSSFASDSGNVPSCN